MTSYDFAVIGAGPGGSLTAARLAQRGARVALIDASHPREKPCGGGITARALALVGGLPAKEVPAVQIRSARFLGSGTGDALVSLPPASTALTVASRAGFDRWLYTQAIESNVTAIPHRLRALHRDGTGFRLDTTAGHPIRSNFIVAADGTNSITRRQLTGPFRRDQLSIATGFYAHGVTSDEIVIEMTSDPDGYIWSFPRPDHLAIGICAQADAGATAASLRDRVRRWIDVAGVGRGARLEPYSWPIPSLSPHDAEHVVVSGVGWIAVGDAAGLVDPITREGIFFALQSATFAAEALTSRDAAPWQPYAERVRAEIGSELARAARYKSRFFQPRFNHLLMEALQTSDGVRRVMADLVAGAQTYRALKWRLAQTLELGLAWRLWRARLAP